MNTLDTIIDLMIRNNCDNKELSSALGLNRQLITDWKAGRSRSFMKYLPQIAEYFEVTVDYLLGTPRETEIHPDISEVKKDLLDLIGSIEDDDKIKQISEYVEFIKGRK